MLAWAILAVMMAGAAGLIAAAQPHAGAVPASPLSDAISRDCLAVFDGGSAEVTLPDGVTIHTSTAECELQAPPGLVTENVLSDAGFLIGGQWVVQSRSGEFVTDAQIAM